MKSLRPGSSWHMHPNMMGPPPALVSLTIFQAAWEAVSNNSCTQAGHVWAASHKHPNQKDKIAPSVRDPEKPALDVWGGAPKLETEGQPSTLKDLNLDAKNFTENWRNKNEWLQNKFKSLMIFPQVMYRTLYLLPGPGYWITVSPTLMLQVILPVGPKIGTAHACFCASLGWRTSSQKLFFDFLVSVFRGQIRLCFTCGGFQLQLILRQMYWRNSKYIKSKRWINGKAAGTCLLGGRW